MTEKDVLAEKLKELIKLSNEDPEAAHGRADGYLLSYINDPEIQRLFAKIKKGYS